MPISPPPEPPILYGRRRGRRLRPKPQALVDRLLPALTVDLPAGAPLHPEALFGGSCKACELEIGFGGGEHLAQRASRHPEVGFIGCEPYLNGVASLLGYVEELGLTNIRVWPNDARLLLPAISAVSISRVCILFPDPWPKRRHAKRRLISTGTLDMLARIMADGAELRLASDDDGYVRWMSSCLINHPDFRWTPPVSGGRPDPSGDWPATRYEDKALRQGRMPIYVTAYRRARGASR
jgi:tRNA (guanine-N7-)-methyltransferase